MKMVVGNVMNSVLGSTNYPWTKKVKKSKTVAKWNYIEKRDRGVVYVGHIPHGFYEDEMKDFFSQFGRVTNVRVVRSAQTGNSKGFGFVQFEPAEVAPIVAEAMNGYLMFNKILKCNVVLQEAGKRGAFFFNKNRIPVPKYVRGRTIYNEPKTDSVIAECKSYMVKKLKHTKEKLAAFGIELNIEKLAPKAMAEEKARLEQETIEKEAETKLKEKHDKKKVKTDPEEKLDKKKLKTELEDNLGKQKVKTEPDEKLDLKKVKTEPEEKVDKKKAKKSPKKLKTQPTSHPVILDPTENEIFFKLPPNTATVMQTKKRKRSSM